MKKQSENKSGKSQNEEEEKLFITQPRAHSKYKTAELILCGVCVIAGVLYIYAKIIPLAVILPFFAVSFTALSIFAFMNLQKNRDGRFASYISVICRALLSLLIIAANVIYFLK